MKVLLNVTGKGKVFLLQLVVDEIEIVEQHQSKEKTRISGTMNMVVTVTAVLMSRLFEYQYRSDA